MVRTLILVSNLQSIVGRDAFFSSYTGGKLQGVPIVHQETGSRIACGLQCISLENNCNAYNFDLTNHMCELFDDYHGLIEAIDHVYGRVHRSSKYLPRVICR